MLLHDILKVLYTVESTVPILDTVLIAAWDTFDKDYKVLIMNIVDNDEVTYRHEFEAEF